MLDNVTQKCNALFTFLHFSIYIFAPKCITFLHLPIYIFAGGYNKDINIGIIKIELISFFSCVMNGEKVCTKTGEREEVEKKKSGQGRGGCARPFDPTPPRAAAALCSDERSDTGSRQ